MVLGIGELPKHYNARVHGVYNPGKYYGPDQRNWKNLKISEIPGFLLSRSKNPLDWGRAVSRSWWRYNLKWMNATNPTMIPVYQLVFMYAAWGYYTHYDEHKSHRQSKYH